jgi:hypothetical protein
MLAISVPVVRKMLDAVQGSAQDNKAEERALTVAVSASVPPHHRKRLQGTCKRYETAKQQ